MRCRWTVPRTMQPDPDGRRRWDRAYQEVLTWTEGLADEPAGVSPDPGAREDGHESGALCPRCLALPGHFTGQGRVERAAATRAAGRAAPETLDEQATDRGQGRPRRRSR